MNVYIKELEKENEELRWQMENFKENYWRQVSTIKDKQL